MIANNLAPSHASTVLAVTVEEAARLLGVGRSTVFELIASGELPSFRIGKSRRVRVADIQQFIAERIEGGAR